MEPKKFVKGKHLHTDWGHGVKEVRQLKEAPAQPAPPQPQGSQLQVELDEAVSRGCYANAALMTHSETEFVLDFAFVAPGQAKARVLSRIVTSPLHAKRLLAALAGDIGRYEARFGPIGPGGRA